MERKHTPGPWQINGSLITSQAAMALIVASVYPPKVGNAPRDMDERDANARLIAAAPDLLAALAETVDDLEAAYDNGTGARPTAISAAIHRARAAIAKAEGR